MSEKEQNQETASAALQKKLKTLESENAELIQQLHAAAQESAELKTQLDTMRRAAGATCEALKKVDDLNHEVVELHSQNEDLKSSLAISQKQLKETEKELDLMGEDLDDEIKTHKADRNLLKEERKKNGELEIKLAEQIKATEEALHKYEQATPEIRTMQETLAANYELIGDLPDTLALELAPLLRIADEMARDPDLGPGPFLQLQELRAHAVQLKDLLSTRTELLYLNIGRLTPTPEPIDIVQLIDGITDAFSERAKAEDSFFAASRSPDLKGTVQADAEKIRRVVNDLLEHALECSPKGRIGLQILRGDSPDEVRFRFSYSGLADDAIVTEGLSDKNTSDMTPTELRMSMTRRYAELLGGTLAMEESTPALLRLTLPMPSVES